MKKILLFLSISISYVSFSQSPNASEQWVEISNNGQVKVSKQLIHCDKPQDDIYKEYFILKFENLTSSSIEVSYNQELWYNNSCHSCGNEDEFSYVINIDPNETLVGSCASDKGLRVFYKMTKLQNKSILTNMEIKNLEVK